jgi:hypothetical protein
MNRLTLQLKHKDSKIDFFQNVAICCIKLNFFGVLAKNETNRGKH